MFITEKSCSILWSWRRSSPLFTRTGWSRSSSPRMIRRLGRQMEDMTFTYRTKVHTCTLNTWFYAQVVQWTHYYVTIIDKKHTLSSKPVIFAWYSGNGLDLPSYCPTTREGKDLQQLKKQASIVLHNTFQTQYLTKYAIFICSCP